MNTERVALVFGGSSGIGRASVQALADDGAAVVVADPDVAGGGEVVSLIEERGGRARFVATDISDEEAVARAVATAEATFDRLDTVVTSAGASVRGDWHRGIDLFLKGTYYACRHAIPALERQGGGSIITIGSVASIRGALVDDVDGTAYAMSKHAVLGLTRTLALGYGPKNIRVNCLCPGYIKTGLTRPLHESPDADAFIKDNLRVPLGRWGEPEDIGRVVAFLASDAAGYIRAIVVDGGLTAR